MPTKHERVLILGGTGEARTLASTLIAEGYDVTTSLAGVTEAPLLPEGRIRRGGFGGVQGLSHYLHEESISCLIDATHPFAAHMAHQAHAAALASGIPLLRLERAPWHAEVDDLWIDAADAEAAVSALPAGANVLLTIGRKEIAAFLAREDVSGIARMIESPSAPLPANWRLLLQRPPFTDESEIKLLVQHRISHVVAKNSGGSDTFAKIVAARRLRIPVVMIARPAKPEVPVFSTAKELVPALRRVLLP